MVSYTVNGGTAIRDYRGDTADEKPVDGVPNGSTYYEIDGEHNVYMFDASTGTWILQ